MSQLLRLSPREMEVARLVAKGEQDKEIALHLGISADTVGRHLGRIYRKLKLRSRVELAVLIATYVSVSAGEAPE